MLRSIPCMWWVTTEGIEVFDLIVPDSVKTKHLKNVFMLKNTQLVFLLQGFVLADFHCCWWPTSKYEGLGALLSSVGSVRNPCAEALRQTQVRLPAWVPLPRVTPPLLPCFLSHSSAILSIKPEKGQKKYEALTALEGQLWTWRAPWSI